MTSAELTKRGESSTNLRVFQVTDDLFYVENSTGKICYKVSVNGHGNSCTCADFTANRKDPEFLCKHLIAALNGNGNHQKIGPTVEMEDRFNEPQRLLGVYQAISAVQMALAKLGIEKVQENSYDHYKFRGIDDIYNALAPLLAKNRLCILPRVINRVCEERKSQKGGALFYVTVDAEFDFVATSDGSKHTVRIFGEAMDRSDKATNKAMSAAYKYACFQTFCIPTEGDNDADFTSHEVKEKSQETVKKEQPKPKPVPKTQAKKESKPKQESKPPKEAKPKPESKPKDESKAKKPAKADPPKGNGAMSPAQAKAIENLAKRRGINEGDLEEMSQKQYGVSFGHLPAKDASAFIRHLQQAA
jgi:hypothetical protein